MPMFVMIDGTPVTLTFGDAQTSFTNTANATITFTGQAISTAAANRYVAVAVEMNSTTSLTVTVGGTACTKVVGTNNGNFFAEIWITNTPIAAGTTANVVFTGTHVANIRVASSTYAVYGPSNPTTPTTGSDTTSTYDIALTIPAGGVAIGAAVTSVLTTWTWSSFTENVDAQLSPITYTSGSRVTAGAFTETVTPAGAGTTAFVAAVWSS